MLQVGFVTMAGFCLKNESTIDTKTTLEVVVARGAPHAIVDDDGHHERRRQVYSSSPAEDGQLARMLVTVAPGCDGTGFELLHFIEI